MWGLLLLFVRLVVCAIGGNSGVSGCLFLADGGRACCCCGCCCCTAVAFIVLLVGDERLALMVAVGIIDESLTLPLPLLTRSPIQISMNPIHCTHCQCQPVRACCSSSSSSDSERERQKDNSKRGQIQSAYTYRSGEEKGRHETSGLHIAQSHIYIHICM